MEYSWFTVDNIYFLEPLYNLTEKQKTQFKNEERLWIDIFPKTTNSQ